VTPARTYPARRDDVRLLVVDPAAARFAESVTTALPDLLESGDLLVVNDAATLPASLRGHDDQGRAIELRLLSVAEPTPDATSDVATDVASSAPQFWAALLGAGDWHQRTEDRPLPPALGPGDRVRFGSLSARIVARSPLSARLVSIRFDVMGDDALWGALYQEARPVQYAYLAHQLPLWAVQTVYAARPWAFEMPSAGRPLSWEILLALRRRGVRVAALTHAAGLSATGDAALDAALPLPERYEIPAPTVNAIVETRARHGRVIAVGTTVVRALEGAAAATGSVPAGGGTTALRIDRYFRPRVVDGVLSGVHSAGESHFDLLSAFVPDAPGLLPQALLHAEAAGFKSHELGDAMLISSGALPRLRRAAGPGVGSDDTARVNRAQGA
jgi:S-adenosylmethionine:tRNA ribosyltransferase-isomerase